MFPLCCFVYFPFSTMRVLEGTWNKSNREKRKQLSSVVEDMLILTMHQSWRPMSERSSAHCAMSWWVGQGDAAAIARPAQAMKLQVLLHSLAHLLYPCPAFEKSASYSSVHKSSLGKIWKNSRVVGRMETVGSAQLLAERSENSGTSDGRR